MNGENSMLGYAEVKVDSKTRIFLPSFTKPVAMEELVFLKKEDFVELWPLSEIVDKVNKLNDLIFRETDINKKKEFQKLSDEITAILKQTHVERDGKRIVIGKKIVEEYNFTNGICIEGKGSYIRLWELSKFFEYQESFSGRSKRTRR